MPKLRFFLLAAFLASSLCLSAPLWAANPLVTVETNRGDFVVELYPEKAPKTVANFMQRCSCQSAQGRIPNNAPELKRP